MTPAVPRADQLSATPSGNGVIDFLFSDSSTRALSDISSIRAFADVSDPDDDLFSRHVFCPLRYLSCSYGMSESGSFLSGKSLSPSFLQILQIKGQEAT